MRKRLSTSRTALAAFALLCLATPPLPAFAQSQPAVGTPVAPSPPGLVDAATQERIRAHVKAQNLPAAELPDTKPGASLPAGVTLYALPEDAVTEVPVVTSYQFVPAGGRIVIVDPKTRTVVQLIDR
jgi:hypothetical protein